MAFILENFAPAAAHTRRGTGGEAVPGAPGIHAYRTQDAAATVDTSGYFNPVAELLQVGDLVYRVTVNSAGVVQTAGWHVVMTKSAAGVVDVSDTTALTVTNTD